MHFSDPERDRFLDDANNFLNRIFESVRIAFPGRESAELTRKDADIGVVDVTVPVRGLAAFSICE